MTKYRVVISDTCIMFFLYNKHHRINGPAVIYSSDAGLWMKHDKLHRLDGPAVIWDNDGDDNTEEWWENGKLIIEIGGVN